jgi:hypothetical protein
MKTVDLYILNAAENSDLRDMNAVERQKIEERRLVAVRFAMGGYNIATTLVLGDQERTAVKMPHITDDLANAVWYRVTTTFGDFAPDRVMFEKIEIEV